MTIAEHFDGFIDDMLSHLSKQAMKKLFPGGVVPSSKQRRKLQPQRTGQKQIVAGRGIDLGNNVEYFPAPTTRSGRK